MSLNFYLSFLDAYSDFHQISMATKDEETISFVTPRGLCCYMNIPYRLKNVLFTFVRMTYITLGIMKAPKKPFWFW